MLKRLLVFAALCFSQAAAAQWPDKPLRVIIPYPPGGIVDVAARTVIGEALKTLKQPVVFESKPGADTAIGTELVAKGEADGSLWLANSTPFTVQMHLRPDLPYDVLRDFAPVAMLAATPLMYVVPADLPPRTFAEVIAYAKQRPGKLFYGSSGNGTVNHLNMEILKKVAGIDVVHVAYKGQPASVPDLLSGRLQFMSLTYSVVAPHIRAGKVRALAVGGGKRVSAFPEIPTLEELGYKEADVMAWVGLAAPAKTPRPLVDAMNQAIALALKSADVTARLNEIGMTPAELYTPERFGAFIKSEISRWSTVVKASEIKRE